MKNGRNAPSTKPDWLSHPAKKAWMKKWQNGSMCLIFSRSFMFPGGAMMGFSDLTV